MLPYANKGELPMSAVEIKEKV
jgi:ATP-dependent RNA helicase DDX55/SPB4